MLKILLCAVLLVFSCHAARADAPAQPAAAPAIELIAMPKAELIDLVNTANALVEENKALKKENKAMRDALDEAADAANKMEEQYRADHLKMGCV